MILTFTATLLCLTIMAQGERKLNKNFSFVLTGKLDTVASFSIEQRAKRSGWGEFYGELSQALIANGFSVIGNDYISKHSYSILIDYGRSFSAGKMQYSHLSGQIIDLSNKSEVIGTFTYSKRFEVDDISKAIASALKNNNPIIIKEEAQQKTTQKIEPQSLNSQKSKEDRLKELKTLFEKELITKEEYDRAKQKIIEE